ncbi:carboxylesterase family protein [Planctomycetes bacterium TBK1r]|uniref:Carboxylesterase family protein n=1 Tax=Stieleria magnilauensis TaxID=2527963 RepID=A0ABX5XSP3_9BACT|nr:Carboxylesterase family protein [Planctomycetes bacterium TBK1r]
MENPTLRWTNQHLAMHVLVAFGALLSTMAGANDGLGPVYRDATYDVTVTKGEPYAQGMIYHPSDPTRSFPRNLTLDVYQPNDNHHQKRPVVVLIHGGGFWTGDSLMWSMVTGAEYFAQRGWVCFSINYRLQGDRGIAPKGWPDTRPRFAAPSRLPASSADVFCRLLRFGRPQPR